MVRVVFEASISAFVMCETVYWFPVMASVDVRERLLDQLRDRLLVRWV